VYRVVGPCVERGQFSRLYNCNPSLRIQLSSHFAFLTWYKTGSQNPSHHQHEPARRRPSLDLLAPSGAPFPPDLLAFMSTTTGSASSHHYPLALCQSVSPALIRFDSGSAPSTSILHWICSPSRRRDQHRPRPPPDPLAFTLTLLIFTSPLLPCLRPQPALDHFSQCHSRRPTTTPLLLQASNDPSAHL
jgi:hypothetical protein